MSRTSGLFLLVPLLLGLPACGGADRSHEGGDHGHDGSVSERPTVATTRWTDRTELFMEYPVFVAGQRGRAAIHLTDLADFSPLREGEAIVTLRSDDGRLLEFRGGPSRPGIFGVDLEVDRVGSYAMTLRVETPKLQDSHDLGSVTVHAAGEPVDASEGKEPEGISFLKEQQWTLDFGTAPAEIRGLRSSITVPAVVAPRAGGEAALAAPVPGRVDPDVTVPVPGTTVRAGAILARIIPRSEDVRDAAALRAALVEAEQAHELALRERDRVERLVEARALPSRRLDEARAAFAASEARLTASRERWGRYEALAQSGKDAPAGATFAVRAPFDGVVSEVGFAPGASVDENEILIKLVDPERVNIVASVPESRASDLRAVVSGEVLVDDAPPIALSRPLSIGRIVEPVTRTTEVRFALDNKGTALQVGRSVQARLFVGDEVSGIAIPESAIVDDAGRPIAFVQAGGETFERRPLRLGIRAGGYVQILEGVRPGERVVHRGAYLVRLAAMSSQIPAHGHVH